MCCAWIARGLMWHGYQAENASTRERVNRWNNAPTAAGFVGHSVDYLRRTGQLRDLDFILGHLDDLNAIFSLREGQIAMIHGEKPVPISAVPKHTSTAARVPNVTPDVEAVGQEVPEPRAQ